MRFGGRLHAVLVVSLLTVDGALHSKAVQS